MATYEATVTWRRAPSEPFCEGRYSRAHEWSFDGGASVRASASPQHVPAPYADPAAVDPEEAFVAALSSCHMLFFLWFAARKGWVVSSYDDQAVGLKGKGPDGREWITRVVLRPRVAFEGATRPSADEVQGLHHASHEACYLANSVRTEVVVEGAAIGLHQEPESATAKPPAGSSVKSG